MASKEEKIARLQEIANRGIQDQLDPRRKAIFDEVVRRGLITIDHKPTPQPIQKPLPAQSQAVPEVNSFKEFAEPLMTIGSSMVAEPVAGIAGIVQSLNPFADEGAGARAVESTRDALTYVPKGENSQGVLAETGKLIQPAAEKLEKVTKTAADKTFDVTGSPTAGAFVATLPMAIAQLLGAKGYKYFKPGERILQNGTATPKFKRILWKKYGIDYDSLPIEIREIVPERAPQKLLPGGKPLESQADLVAAERIKAGGTENKLAKYTVAPEGTVIKDAFGAEAIKNGFPEGDIASIKAANSATKTKMQKMLQIMKTVKSDKRAGVDIRPSDVAGDAVVSRIKFLNTEIDKAGSKLNHLAETRLKGYFSIDPAPVEQAFTDAAESLGIKVIKSDKGVRLDFNGSDIMEHKGSQNAFRAMQRLMNYGGQPDALRFHKLKRQLDAMLDYRKKDLHGIDKSGEKAVRQVRKSLNEALRNADADYASLNDTLSSAISATESLDKATGSLNIFAESADSSLGTVMRRLMSNAQSRVPISDSLDEINKVVSQLGGKFDDDVKTLAMFADTLEKRFGTTATTSFAGDIGGELARAAQKGPRRGAVDIAAGLAKKGADKVRGVDDYTAFKSMEDLLKAAE